MTERRLRLLLFPFAVSPFLCGVTLLGCHSPAAASPYRQASGAPPRPVAAPKRPEQKKAGYFSAKGRFYMPPAPREAPSLAPGRRFFCLSERLHGLVTPDGRPAPDSEVTLKILVLREVSADRITFASEDGAKTYVLPLAKPNPTAESLPGGIVPVLEDVEEEALREKYAGKFVVPFQFFDLIGRVSDPEYEGMFKFTGATVRRLFRIRAPRRRSMSTGWYDFSTYDPIVVLFGAPQGLDAIISSGGLLDPWYVGEEKGDGVRNSTRKGNVICFALFAGAWDLERAVSLISQEEAGKSWSPKLREAVSTAQLARWSYQHLQKGMTPDMVAWVLGWPHGYGTRDELRRQSRWTYREGGTGDVSVFFRNGRVVKWIGREVFYEDYSFH